MKKSGKTPVRYQQQVMPIEEKEKNVAEARAVVERVMKRAAAAAADTTAPVPEKRNGQPVKWTDEKLRELLDKRNYKSIPQLAAEYGHTNLSIRTYLSNARKKLNQYKFK